MKRLIPILLLAALFAALISHTARQQRLLGKQVLEDALRRSAVACYACEGFYPPDVDYLMDHYGLIYDEDRYLVHYQSIAANLMPDITVVEKAP